MIDAEQHNKKYYRDMKIFWVIMFTMTFGVPILSKILSYFG